MKLSSVSIFVISYLSGCTPEKSVKKSAKSSTGLFTVPENESKEEAFNLEVYETGLNTQPETGDTGFFALPELFVNSTVSSTELVDTAPILEPDTPRHVDITAAAEAVVPVDSDSVTDDAVTLENIRDSLCSAVRRYWSWDPSSTGFYTQYVGRQTLLRDSVDILMSIDRADLGANRIRVRFSNEAGVGQGVQIDWISSLAEAFFSNGDLFVDKGSYKVLGVSDDLHVYATIGRFLAHSILNNVSIGVVLPVHYWAWITRNGYTLDDIKEDEPELFRQWTNLLAADNIDDWELDWNDAPVTVDNRKEYVEHLRLGLIPQSDHSRLNIIRDNFLDIIPLEAISGLASPLNLQMMVAGDPFVNIDDMRRNIIIGDVSDTVVVWFFEILESWDNDMRLKLIRFATSRTRLPFGGFAGLNPRMSLQRVFTLNSLPMAHTCFNELGLSNYDSKEILLGKLQLALSSEMTMHLT